MQNDYAVGFGKPPKDSQFKPGQSGNNNGRPKGIKNKNPIDLIIKELDTTVQLKDGTKITKGAAIAKQLCNSAAAGVDFKSTKLVMDIIAKQQPISLAKGFLDKLIRENYITEKDAEEYLNHGTLLNPKAVPEAIRKLCYGTFKKRSWAISTMLSIVFLAVIKKAFISSLYLAAIREAVTTEYNFWQGVDTSLSGLKLSEKERAKLIKKAARGRKYERPDDYLYNAAVKAHLFWTFEAMVCFNNRRDFCKSIDGYAEAEKLLLNDEIKKLALANARYEMKEADFNNFEEGLDYYKKTYIDFNEEKPLPDAAILAVDPTYQELRALRHWYANTSK